MKFFAKKRRAFARRFLFIPDYLEFFIKFIEAFFVSLLKEIV